MSNTTSRRPRLSQSSPSSEAPSRTCLNPNAHHISVTRSQSWTWVTLPTPSRSLPSEVRKRLLCLRWHQTHDQDGHPRHRA